MAKKNYKSDLPCLVCMKEEENAVCFHHVKTQGSGGTDDSWNLMPLCFKCHEEVHKKGLSLFSALYIQVGKWLSQNGWEYCSHQNKWSHE